MQQNARATLVSLVEDHITGLIRDTISVQRHTKRTRLHEASSSSGGGGSGDASAHGNNSEGRSSVRRRLHATDINMALQLAGSEKLYATPVVPPDPDDPTTSVDLEDFLRTSTESMPAAPSEVSLRMTWLAVNGAKPSALIGKNHNNSLAAVPIQDTSSDAQAGVGGGVRVNKLQSSLLSEELQLYFARLTMAMELGSASVENRMKQETVLADLTVDPGLQELVPFMVRYCQQNLYKHVNNTEHCRTLVRLALALLRNPNIHLELHLHEILPALLTCVVAKKLSANHWALRREASVVVVSACDVFGEEYSTLRSRILKRLHEAIHPSMALGTRYGGIVCITLFGPRVIDSLLLPSLTASWLELEESLDKVTSTISGQKEQEEIHMCQQALLEALSLYLPRVGAAAKAERLDWRDLERVFGDKVVSAQGGSDEYIDCFI